ncbi:MAG: hypothetical protein CVU73_15650 [Deltaproteobacteria bacterium HGW-Deltaproteobacteria-8]|jgi:hypothetical protein|nr:MAG: hypothetical protein CVU73_15650 [Deltaproteobacteria bacterium HGW-Deltaproteobacteria-8]
MSICSRTLGAQALPAASLALVFALCPPSGQALAASSDCPALFDLYRACHSRGLEADSNRSCLEESAEDTARALAQCLGGNSRRNPRAAHALAELVCGTGCDDALSRRQPATRKEFTEAFCD